MSSDDFLYQQNEFVIVALLLVALIAVGEAAYWLGRRRRVRLQAKSKAGEVGEEGVIETAESHLGEVQAAVFALLGLLLAFTVSMSVGRYDTRKQDLVDEVNAIGVAYLRADLLPPAQQAVADQRFRRYVDLRLASASPTWEQDTALRNQMSAVQQQLWTQGVAIARQNPRDFPGEIYLESLNDMFDAQGKRDAARLNHLPTTTLYMLFAVSIVAVGIGGYRSGLGTSGRSVVGASLLALLIVVVVLIILDLDHPYQGLITISQQSMFQLRQSMGP